MEDSGIGGHDARVSSNPEQTAAEKIVRDAEAREGKEPIQETVSSYLGMKRKEAPSVEVEPPLEHSASTVSDAPAGDNPAPFSSALGIPTLVKEDAPEPSSAPKEDNPAPLSSALHIPTLITESKPASEG